LPTDESVLLVLEAALLITVIVALVKDSWAAFRAGRGSLSATVTRGERSMATLTGVLASVAGLYVFAIEVADTAIGYKSFLIVIDFLLIGYLFLFNNWFRNRILGIANERLEEKR